MTRLTPIILAVALFMEQMDSTIIATALPVIAADLGVGPITLKLALTAYLVALAVFIPVSGWMADRFGPRRIFLIAIVIFMAGSLACAFAGSLADFVLARFLQGMGGAMMSPVGRAIIVRGADKKDLVSAMAMFTLPAVVGPLFGPPVGGFIATYVSWHWIFLVNLPIGVIGILMTLAFVPETATERPPPPDLVGLALAGFSAASFVFGLSVIYMPALPPILGGAAVVAGLMGALAWRRHARRVENPALDPSLFAIPTFRQSIVSASLFRIAMGSVPFLAPLMLQLGFGLNAFQSGMITFSATFGMIATKFVARPILKAVGFRIALIVAAIASAGGTIAYGWLDPSLAAVMIIVMVAAGFVRSFYFTGINVLVFADVEARQTSQAAAINGVFQQVSVAVGIAFAGILIDLSPLVTGSHLGLADFRLAFLATGLFALLAILPLLRLPGNAGAAVSGHRPEAE